MSKELLIVAFPESAAKIVVVQTYGSQGIDLNNSIEDMLCWQPQLEEKVDHFMNKYPEIKKITILGPAVYTQKIVTDMTRKFAANKDMKIEIAEV